MTTDAKVKELELLRYKVKDDIQKYGHKLTLETYVKFLDNHILARLLANTRVTLEKMSVSDDSN